MSDSISKGMDAGMPIMQRLAFTHHLCRGRLRLPTLPNLWQGLARLNREQPSAFEGHILPCSQAESAMAICKLETEPCRLCRGEVEVFPFCRQSQQALPWSQLAVPGKPSTSTTNVSPILLHVSCDATLKETRAPSKVYAKPSQTNKCPVQL